MEQATLYSQSVQRTSRHAFRAAPLTALQGSVLTWRLGVLTAGGALDDMSGVTSVSLAVVSYGGAKPGSARWIEKEVLAADFTVPTDADSVLDETEWNAEVTLSSEETTLPVSDSGEREYWYEWRAQLAAGGESVLASGVLILRGTSQNGGIVALGADVDAEEAARIAADAALTTAGNGLNTRLTTAEGQVVTINTTLPAKANAADVAKERAPAQRPIVTRTGPALTMVQGDLGSFVYDTHFADSTLTIPAGLGPTADALAAESERFNNSPGRRSVLAAGGVTVKPPGVVLPAYTAALFTRVAADTWTVIPYGLASAVSGTPAATAIPIIEGNHIVGQALTLTRATWAVTPSGGVTIQWMRGQTAISGATGTTYVLTSDDVGFVISALEVATNGSGSTYVGSLDTAIVDVGIWLDTVNGNDARTGIGPSQSVRTPTRLMALVPDATDKNVVVATDSYSEEMLTLIGDRLHLMAIGSGEPPLFDASSVIPLWTKTEGFTNLWEATLTLPGNVSVEGNLWADGNVINTKPSTLGTTDLTPDSAYIVDWTAPTTKVYLHAAGSVNPNTDGKEYRYSARDQGVNLEGEHIKVTGIWTRRNAGQPGSLKIKGEYPILTDVRCEAGARHHCFVQPFALVRYSVFDGQSGNNQESPFFSNTIVCNATDIIGKSWRLEYCTFGNDTGPALTGPLQHGANETHKFALVEHDHCTYIRLSSCGSLGADQTNITYPIFDRVTGGFTWATAGNNVLIENGTGTANQITAPSGGGTVVCRNNVISTPLLGPGFHRYDLGTLLNNLELDNELYTITDGVAAVGSNQLIRWNRGNIKIRNSRVLPILCNMADDMVYAGMNGGTCTYDAASTGNVWPIGARFSLNGVVYNTLALFQAAGYEIGSTTAASPASVKSDTFTGAASALDLKSGVTVVGTANTMGINGSGSVGSIVATATNTFYQLVNMAGADYWMEVVLGTIPPSSSPYASMRSIDEANGILYRATSTNHTINVMVGGTLTLLVNLAGLTPVAGDVVRIAVKGSRLWLYVNGRCMRKGLDFTAPALAAATKAGFTRRGGVAFATSFTSFKTGLNE